MNIVKVTPITRGQFVFVKYYPIEDLEKVRNIYFDVPYNILKESFLRIEQ